MEKVQSVRANAHSVIFKCGTGPKTNLDLMIFKASHHLVGSEPDHASQSSNTLSVPSPKESSIGVSVSRSENTHIKKSDLDNFPLVPLQVIPYMETTMLHDCKAKLLELIDTLTTDQEDISLGHVICLYLTMGAYMIRSTWENSSRLFRPSLKIDAPNSALLIWSWEMQSLCKAKFWHRGTV